MKLRNPRGGFVSFIAIAVVLVIILVIIGAYVFGTFVNIGTGQVAILRNTYTGEVTVGPTGPMDAPFQKSPFFVDVIPVTVSVSSVTMCSVYGGNQSDTPTRLCDGAQQPAPIGITKDGIQVAVAITVSWTLNASDKTRIINLYRSYPTLNYEDVTIIPTIDRAVRDVLGNLTFYEVYNDRTSLPGPIEREIIGTIQANPTLSGTVLISPAQIQISGIHIPFAIANSLQLQKAAQINVQTALYNRNVTIINAIAQANATIAAARGQALAVIIQANASYQAIVTNVRALCPSCNATYTAKVAQYYYTLVTLQQMAASGRQVVFLIGTNSQGQLTLFQIPASQLANATQVPAPK